MFKNLDFFLSALKILKKPLKKLDVLEYILQTILKKLSYKYCRSLKTFVENFRFGVMEILEKKKTIFEVLQLPLQK